MEKADLPLEVQIRDQPLRELLFNTRFEVHLPLLVRARVERASDVLRRGAELHTVLRAADGAELAALQALCGGLFAPPQQTPLSMAAPRTVSWGDERLDVLFGGGLTMAGIVELAGQAGSGKTQLALWLSLQALAGDARKDARVVYITTEGDFPASRFEEMQGGCAVPGNASQRVLVEKADSFDSLWTLLTTRIQFALNRMPVALLVIDSVGALRSDYDNANQKDRTARTNHLWKLAQLLKYISDSYGCGVLVTNQVRADMQAVSFNGEEHVTPTLGLVWSNCINSRIMVAKTHQKVGDEAAVLRQMTVTLSSHLPMFCVPFIVTRRGIEAVE